MEFQSNFNVKQVNQRVVETNYRQRNQKRVSKKQCKINSGISRINSLMSDLVPTSRRISINDINLLQLTIEYLKQTTDFRTGVNLCAEETKIFLNNHCLDGNKMNKLVKEINQRIINIPEPQQFQVKDSRFNSTNITDSFLQNTWMSDQPKLANGVLLDLSVKQNLQRDEDDCHKSTNRINVWCINERKRAILDKIRKRILDKRRLSGTVEKVEIVEGDVMWRPWRL